MCDDESGRGRAVKAWWGSSRPQNDTEQSQQHCKLVLHLTEHTFRSRSATAAHLYDEEVQRFLVKGVKLPL